MTLLVMMLPLICFTMLRIWDPRKSKLLTDRIAWTVFASSVYAMIFIAIHSGHSEDGSFRSWATIRLHTRLFNACAAVALIAPVVIYVRQLRRPRLPRE
jgi:hypothetical protein